MEKCCEKALRVLPEVNQALMTSHKKIPVQQTEARLLILLADAAEARGDTRRALEYDEKAKNLWLGSSCKGFDTFVELVPVYRRKAV